MTNSINATFYHIKAVYNLTAISFLRNKGALFFTLFFPLLLFLIFAAVFKNSSGIEQMGTVNIFVSGITVAAITGNGLNGLSVRLTQWRQSTIVKRMGSTPLKQWEFLSGALFFYITVMTVQTLWLIGIAFAFQNIVGNGLVLDDVRPLFIVISAFLTMLFAVSLGVFLASLSNDVNTNSLIGIMIFLPAAFLSGQYIPLQTINNGGGVLKVFSEIWPQRYIVIYMYHGWGITGGVGGIPWDLQNILLGAFYPTAISLLAIFIASKKFKWE